MLLNSLKFQHRNVQTFGHVFHYANGQNHRESWRSRGISWTKFARSSISWIAVGKTIRRSLIKTWMGENSELGMFVRSSKTRLMKNVDFDEPTSFLDHVYLGCTQRECKPKEAIIEQHTKMCESRISAGATEKLTGWQKPHAQTSAWSYDMAGHAQKCVERYCELAHKKVEQRYKVSHPCLDDQHSKQEELESVWDVSEVCSQIVLKCLYVARICRPDILWSVNKLARSVTKWTQACDRRLARLITYIHYTSDFRQYCHVGNTAQHCRLGLFQDSDFAFDLEDSKSTSGCVLCIFGSRTFVLVSWMCKKQTSVSHCSSESEVISLDAGLRMDGLPALDFWCIVIEVLRTNTGDEQPQITSSWKREAAQPNHTSHQESEAGTSARSSSWKREAILKSQTKTKSVGESRKVDQWRQVDHVPANTRISQGESKLYIFEDSDAVVKMIIKERNPVLRHMSSTHRVALDWLFDRIKLEPKI